MNDDYAVVLSNIEKIIDKYDNGSEEFTVLKKDMGAVHLRLQDKFLYLGVIGSFSSGKSTFINSILGKNILPTDAVQGTTVAASILKRSEHEDLEVRYDNGDIASFSSDPERFCKRYGVMGPDVKPGVNKSLFSKIMLFLKRLFGIREDSDPYEKNKGLILDIFRRMISTEEVASDIEYATYLIDNEKILYDIALVDTPGTESLNERHNKVTKNAIDNICDALVVIIPSDEPVSVDLINYIQYAMDSHKGDCIFVVTKIETLSDQEELPRLLRVIKRRLEKGLEVEDPIVIPMPTFLHLKNTDEGLKTTFLDDLDEAVKEDLLDMFDNGLSQIYDILIAQRNDHIRRKIAELCIRITGQLNGHLNLIVDEKDRIGDELDEKSVRSLSDFEREVAAMIDGCKKKIEERGRGELYSLSDPIRRFRQDIIDRVEKCPGPTEIMRSIGSTDLDGLFMDLQKIASVITERSDREKTQCLKQIEDMYHDEYKNCGVSGKIWNDKISMGLQDIKDYIASGSIRYDAMIQTYMQEIEASRKGLLKKVKLFFSDPFEKQKGMILNGIQQFFSEMENDIKRLFGDIIGQFSSGIKKDMLSRSRDMIDIDRAAIEGYIMMMRSKIDDNILSKSDVLNDIRYIEEQENYIKEIS